ncbi:MAG: response regulator [Methanospirillum sp.]|uniref:response regulator n=1 Tax=Methanospirillum sp. TaxID=45200 RepID=UPI00237459D4|nr:response regulator [Methanospirillum sp.]MDD1727731.1 response regulator [Methanospirillum sp.]
MRGLLHGREAMPQGSKILVVEDEMIISMEIKQKLQVMGYVVTGQAITGESAIQKAGETQPDLILMDIRLKGDMDGITAAKRIIDLYDLPIIFLTAHSDKATLERAIAVSPSGYLLKPFKERELMTNIEMSLHKHRVKQKLKEEITPLSSPGIYKELSLFPVPVMTTTKSGLIEYVNPAALRMTGYQEPELVKKPILSLIGEQEHVRDATAGESLPARPHPIMPDQVGLRHKNGTSLPITISVGLITGETEDDLRNLYMFTGSEILETADFHFGPGIIQNLMQITAALKLPAFVLDKRMVLAGYNHLFTEMARKAGISQYMLNRPMFETPNFLLFADMQDLQEIFISGDTNVTIKKFKTGDEVAFIQFTRIPLKKDKVTTHIATVMLDVTNEQQALYEVERIKKVFSELFSALEQLRTISREI